MAKFILWQGINDKKWYWHLKSDKNGQIICWAEGYNQKTDALYSINWVRTNAKTATLREI